MNLISEKDLSLIDKSFLNVCQVNNTKCPFGIYLAICVILFLCTTQEVFSQGKTTYSPILEEISLLIENSKLHEADKRTDSLLLMALKLKDSSLLANTYNFKGVIKKDQKKIKESIEYYNKSLDIYKRLKNERKIADTYVNLGSIFSDLKEEKMALNYYFKALSYLKKLKNMEAEMILLNNIGNIYKDMADYTSAAYYFDKAMHSSYAIKDSFSMAMVSHNLGVNYYLQKNTDSAIKYYNRSLNYLSNYDEGIGHVYNYEQISQSYLDQNNTTKAELYAHKALSILHKAGIQGEETTLFSLLSSIYEKKKDYKNAFKYKSLYSRITDSVNNLNSGAEVLKIEFENQKKEEREQIAKDRMNREAINEAIMDAKNKKLIYSYIGIGLVLILVLFIFRSYKQKQKANEIISKQKELVEQKNEEILSSINYAKRIQYALLAHDDYLKKHLPEHFVYFNPKDIVSGDFYWATTARSANSNRFYLAVCDSTGHGVPGAFMSLLNIGFIAEAINEKNIYEPGAVFDYVRERLIDSISKEGQKDGFDGILMCFELDSNSAICKITYAAANNSPLIISENGIRSLDNDRMPVGIGERKENFRTFELTFKNGETLYLYTDGYADQFGGPKGKKFKYKQLDELLSKNAKAELPHQRKLLEDTFNAWKGDLEQVDDVCVIGIKL